VVRDYRCDCPRLLSCAVTNGRYQKKKKKKSHLNIFPCLSKRRLKNKVRNQRECRTFFCRNARQRRTNESEKKHRNWGVFFFHKYLTKCFLLTWHFFFVPSCGYRKVGKGGVFSTFFFFVLVCFTLVCFDLLLVRFALSRFALGWFALICFGLFRL
jgi:hypothetical protein